MDDCLDGSLVSVRCICEKDNELGQAEVPRHVSFFDVASASLIRVRCVVPSQLLST